MHGRFKIIRQLRQLLQYKHNSVLGIDITSSAIRILELAREGTYFRVKNYGWEALPSNTINGNTIQNTDAISSCIKKLIVNLSTSCNQAVLAVPDAAAISRIVQIPAGLADEEMQELIIIEADKYISYPLNEINLDFEILGSCKKNAALLDVLVVASRAEHVNQRVEATIRAGLRVIAVDVAGYAIARAMQGSIDNLLLMDRDKQVAIIEIDTHSIRLFVMQGRNLIYSRDEPYLDKESLMSLQENIFSQIKKALRCFYSTSQDKLIDFIFLAGGLPMLPGLVVLIQEQLGIMTAVANPFLYMMPGKMINWNVVNNDAPTLLVACGLALKNWV